MSTDIERQSLNAAENILRTMDYNLSPGVVLAALRLAYTTGYRDRQAERVAELIERDDRISEVT